MAPSHVTPISEDGLKERDTIPSFKTSDLIKESQSASQDLQLHSLPKGQVHLWAMFWKCLFSSASAKFRMQIASLQKENAALKLQVELLQNSISTRTLIADLTAFEKDALTTCIVVKNICPILFEIGFPSCQVSLFDNCMISYVLYLIVQSPLGGGVGRV